MIPHLVLKLLIVSVAVVLLSGCQRVGYYMQLGQGHVDLMLRREAIDSIINDASTDQQLAIQLNKVRSIRQFASETLQLPDNDSYTTYVDINRDAVVWNVVAAPQFSVEPKTWCFPITGCVSYRGYFDKKHAEEFALQLERQGYDTYIAEAAAYSTLGWFSDPVLSTFVNRSDLGLAGLIFHELAHQQFFMSGDTAFNESFATAVQIEGVRLWLTRIDKPDAIEDYLRRLALGRDFVATMLGCRDRFSEYYQSTASPSMEGKQVIIDGCLSQEYSAFKARWDNYEGYDQWVAELNNAKLVSLGDYNLWVDAFSQLLKNQANDFERFYLEVEKLAQLEPDVRNKALKALTIPE